MGKLRIFLTLFISFCLLFSTALFAQPAVEVTKSGIKEHVVQEGDTLEKLAVKYYDDKALGRLLWQANKNLVNNPKGLTAGDTLYIFPEATLKNQKKSSVPPAPVEPREEIYQSKKEYNLKYPKYFSFLADERGLGATGAIRIKTSVRDPKTSALKTSYVEVREVGEIVASEYRGVPYHESLVEIKTFGKSMMSTGDSLTVRITEDIAKILDSDSYDEADPYFREFAVYGYGNQVRETGKKRADKGATLGTILEYRGRVVITSRIEGGIAPVGRSNSSKAKNAKNQKRQDVEPVAYIAKILASEDAIYIGDKLFLFVDLDEGHERMIEPPYVEPADSYVSPGY